MHVLSEYSTPSVMLLNSGVQVFQFPGYRLCCVMLSLGWKTGSTTVAKKNTIHSKQQYRELTSLTSLPGMFGSFSMLSKVFYSVIDVISKVAK